MSIEKADFMGFCFGVKNAVDRANHELSNNSKLVCYGDIIHNKDVVTKLENDGLIVVEDIEETLNYTNYTVLIRSHGVSKRVIEFLESNNINYIDATCPKVKNIHKIVEKYSKDNHEILVVGDGNHPEITGIIGWISGDHTLIETLEDVEKFNYSLEKKYCLVCQTTFNFNILKEIVEIFNKNDYTNMIVHNTICDATLKRQNSCEELAARSDLLLVIGGKNSSNTKKLYELGKLNCENTFLIENYKEIPYKYIDKNTKIGITAGASTPEWVIEEVILNVRAKQNNE